MRYPPRPPARRNTSRSTRTAPASCDHEAGQLTAEGIKTATVTASESATLKCPEITLDGNVTVTGLFTYQAGMSGKNGKGNNTTITGDLRHTDGDLSSHGVILHKHPTAVCCGWGAADDRRPPHDLHRDGRQYWPANQRPPTPESVRDQDTHDVDRDAHSPPPFGALAADLIDTPPMAPPSCSSAAAATALMLGTPAACSQLVGQRQRKPARRRRAEHHRRSRHRRPHRKRVPLHHLSA